MKFRVKFWKKDETVTIEYFDLEKLVKVAVFEYRQAGVYPSFSAGLSAKEKEELKKASFVKYQEVKNSPDIDIIVLRDDFGNVVFEGHCKDHRAYKILQDSRKKDPDMRPTVYPEWKVRERFDNAWAPLYL